MPVLAPAIRDEYGLSLAQIGVVLAAEWAGSLATVLLWGLAADRVGERVVLATGLGGCAVALAASGFAPGFWSLVALLALAGATGGSVIAASGRAVMHWFGPEERGLALGVRQTAIPVGGLAGAFGLPIVERAGGLEAAFLALGAFALLGALVGGLLLRERAGPVIDVDAVPWTLRDGRLWRLCSASGLYVVAQVGLMSFSVLFLHDARGFSTGAAAAVLGGIQALAAVLRIAAGRWSDVLGARIVPLRHLGVAITATVVLVAAVADAPAWVLVPFVVVAGGLSMAWNGLSFTAAAEFAGRRRSGAAIGVQQTFLSAVGVAAPIGFAAAVSAFSWQAAYALTALFPLVGWWVLRPLAER